MDSNDPNHRGLAAWAAGPIAGKETIPKLKLLIHDQGHLTLYRDGQIAQYSVGRLAQEAILTIEPRQK
jgi:hypothetical protein